MKGVLEAQNSTFAAMAGISQSRIQMPLGLSNCRDSQLQIATGIRREDVSVSATNSDALFTS